MKKNTDSISTSYVDIMEKNHMEIPWHDYTGDDSNVLISDAELIEKASVIGRVGKLLKYLSATIRATIVNNHHFVCIIHCISYKSLNNICFIFYHC